MISYWVQTTTLWPKVKSSPQRNLLLREAPTSVLCKMQIRVYSAITSFLNCSEEPSSSSNNEKKEWWTRRWSRPEEEPNDEEEEHFEVGRKWPFARRFRQCQIEEQSLQPSYHKYASFSFCLFNLFPIPLSPFYSSLCLLD